MNPLRQEVQNDVKIDYLSWTLMHDPRDRGDEHQMWLSCITAIWKAFPTWADWCSQQSGWHSGGARGHYGFSQFNDYAYAAVRFGGSANHILIEMPGTACQWLRDTDILDQVVREACDHLTRIDIAVDIPGGCSPTEFVNAGHNERFKSHAQLVSESGTTEYIGSMKSERYSRVYMYAPPHPRSGTLRVEHVLRSEFAKTAATVVASSGLLELAALLGNSFGWQHANWQPASMTDGKLKASRADRHEPGRVKWLHQVVLPAIVKASRDGLIDLDDFWRRIFELSSKNPQ